MWADSVTQETWDKLSVAERRKCFYIENVNGLKKIKNMFYVGFAVKGSYYDKLPEPMKFVFDDDF